MYYDQENLERSEAWRKLPQMQFSHEENKVLLLIKTGRVDSVFGNEAPIAALIRGALVERDNGFLRLTPLGKQVVETLPPPVDRKD